MSSEGKKPAALTKSEHANISEPEQMLPKIPLEDLENSPISSCGNLFHTTY